MSEPFVRDPRVVAAAQAIAGAKNGRRETPAQPVMVSAADYHEAIVAVRAADEVMFSPDGIDRAEQAYKDLIAAWGRGEANCDVPDVVRAVTNALKGTP